MACLLVVQFRLWVPNFDTHNVTAVLTWDALGYYLYLPAHFIYHDLATFSFMPDIMREYQPSGSYYQSFPFPGAAPGAQVMKYPIGLAVLNTPFFGLGHWAAGHWGYKQDGFSAPYQMAISLGGLLYALLGLGLLRRVLLRYVSDGVTTLTLAVLVLGTNYLLYAGIDHAMTHSTGFTLYAVLLWLTVRYHERPQRWSAAAIGLVLGLQVIVRPSDAVAVFLPLLWGVTSGAAARQKLALLRQRWPDVALLVAFGLVGVLPQLAYWKWVSGHWVVYSYEKQGFSFLAPHTWQVLFSFRKGWLVFTPLMALALAGLPVLWRRNRAVGVPVLVYFVLNLWVVSAWDIWWYGGSLGQRALVQSYAALALPLAYAIAWLADASALTPTRRWLRGTALAGAVLLVNLNLVQHWQYLNGYLDGENMNRRLFWAVFDKIHPTQDNLNLLDSQNRRPGTLDDYTRRPLALLTFEGVPATDSTGVKAGFGNRSGQSFQTNAARPYSPVAQLPVRQAQLPEGTDKHWVRGSVWVWSEYGAWGQRLVVSRERAGKTMQWESINIQNGLSISQRWTQVWLDVPLTSADLQPDDVLKTFVLGEGGAPCYLDDLQLEALDPKTGW